MLCFQLKPMLAQEAPIIDIATMETVTKPNFEKDIQEEAIEIVYYTSNLVDIYVKKTDGTYYKTINPEYETFKKDLLDKGLIVRPVSEFNAQNKQAVNGFTLIVFMCTSMAIISIILRLIYFRMMEKQHDGAVNTALAGGKKDGLNLTKEPNKEKDANVKSFDDIAGLYEVKKDVKCLVDFLKNKDKYIAAGAELPKGVIFYGPPGTGKTLLAKAIAGEAGIPFHYMSGSDFVEMYVGMGAKRVRELFEKAKKSAPCIIFIDEIDAIGGSRGKDDSSGEDRKTLNALLTEMDGFKKSENILVIAATNRLEDLDSALVRPGRFTNKFCVPLPETAKERLEVIRLYAKNKKFAEDVNLKSLSKETIGFSPAAIESLLNEAAIISVQDDKKFIDQVSLDKAMFKVLMSGHVKENQADRNKEELRLVAWHEAGHALIGKLNGKSIPKVTILSTTSGAGGVTFTTPKQMGLYSVDDLKAEVAELYAGRAAELMLLKDKNKVTTGASNDIEKATNIIKQIVTSYGMSDEFGMLNLNQLNVSQTKIIEQEVKLAKEIEARTVETLTVHYEQLKMIAAALLERETLYEADLVQIIKENKITPVELFPPSNFNPPSDEPHRPERVRQRKPQQKPSVLDVLSQLLPKKKIVNKINRPTKTK